LRKLTHAASRDKSSAESQLRASWAGNETTQKIIMHLQRTKSAE